MEAGIWTIWDRNPTSNELKQTNMYKVGDKVTIRRDLQSGEQYGCLDFYSSYMGKFLGEQVTIRHVDSSDNTYKIEGDPERSWWSSEMFEDNPSNKLFKLM